MLPFQVFGIWIRGLLAIAVLAGGIYLLVRGYNESGQQPVAEVEIPKSDPPRGEDADATPRQTPERRNEETRGADRFTIDRKTLLLLGGALLCLWSIGGGWTISPRLFRRVGADEPKASPSGRDSKQVTLPDGSRLATYSTGRDSEPIVMTHGWSLSAAEWYYAERELGRNHRAVSWDLPGLGESDRPTDRDWSLEKLARDLDQVIRSTGDQPVVLMGHSIGVMITLTYCKIFPEALGRRIAGLVLVHGTYTNPVRTTRWAAFYTAIEKPIIVPLCHLMVWLSPLLWLLNWLSFFNGSAHRSTERDSFSGQETRGQLDLLTKLYCQAAPAVVGRGMLAMLKYDATDVLRTIPIPTLIVAAEDDKSCPMEASEFMAKNIPQARLVVLPKMRHCGHFEAHPAFTNAVNEFLASLSTVRTA